MTVFIELDSHLVDESEETTRQGPRRYLRAGVGPGMMDEACPGTFRSEVHLYRHPRGHSSRY